MNNTWTMVLNFLASPVGQKLVQSSEQAVVEAIGGLIQHAHESSKVKS
jgi:hypothetical protein